MTNTFEIAAYPDNDAQINLTKTFRDVNAAKSWAGRMAKRIDAPVDIAYSNDLPWNDRYVTTAAPSVFNTTGYRFERLDA